MMSPLGRVKDFVKVLKSVTIGEGFKNCATTSLMDGPYMYIRNLRLFLSYNTVRITDLDTLNLIKLGHDGLILGLSQFSILPQLLQKWSKVNQKHLASSV